jgi:hypothetical protein
MGGAVLLALAAPASAQELPTWLAGCWEMQDGAQWTDECWMSPRGGVMLGASRSGEGAALTSWEAMQITIEPAAARRDAVPQVTFWASPSGAPRTPFVLEPSALPGATFVNLANEYPQRVRYWRDGALLKAEISLADGSKPMRWTFAPAGGE